MLKYQKIASNIEKFIKDENLKPGDKLPTLNELVNKYGTSKTTIVKTLEVLEARSIIYKVQGSGIFVRRNKFMGAINLQTNNLAQRIRSKAKTIEFDLITPPPEVAEQLYCEEGEKVYYIKRLRYYKENEVLAIEISYYRETLTPGITEEVIKGSLFDYVRKELGLIVNFSDKYLTIGCLDEEEAKLLELEKGDPCLRAKEVFYLTNGKPFDYSYLTYSYKNANFYLHGVNLHDYV
ncbi:MAG: GntR family transcriptional regulator [Micrococcaceae bacterium]